MNITWEGVFRELDSSLIYRASNGVLILDAFNRLCRRCERVGWIRPDNDEYGLPYGDCILMPVTEQGEDCPYFVDCLIGWRCYD
jgi:hypothetical protein